VEKVAVTKPGDSEETIVHRGALLPDWVDDFTEFVLSSSGMVKGVSDPDTSLVPRASLPEPVRLPEHAPRSDEEREARSAAARAEEQDQIRSEGGLAKEGEEARPTMLGGLENPEVIGLDPVDRSADGPRAAGSRPHGNASQTAWREYHVEQLRAQGVEEQEARERAAGMSRDDIRDQYK
jgi:hypothetical protein